MFDFKRAKEAGNRVSNHVLRWAWTAALGAALLPGMAHADQVLYSEDFEATDLNTRWVLTGDWRFRNNSPCLGNDVGYASPFNALVFDYGSACSYANERFGFATLTKDITLPLSKPNVTLRWNDYVGAELGSDFYFVQISTDGGVTWPYEILRDSIDEKFWDTEIADLSPFVGKAIRLRFGFTSDSTITGAGWYLDDVKVVAEDLPAGVSAVAITGGSVTEGNSGDVDLNFTIQVSPKNSSPITLEHATVNGTALAGLDFVGSSGPVTIPANTDTFTLGIKVRGDAFTEGNETFSVEISNPSANAVIAAASADGTIVDDEGLTCSYVEDFEPKVGTFRWTPGYASDQSQSTDPASIGLWHVQANSACNTSGLGYASSNHAMIFNDETACAYDDVLGWNASDPANPVIFTRMINSEPIPGRDALTAQLSFNHYLEIAYNAIQNGVTTASVQVSSTGAAGPWVTLKEYKPTTPSADNFVIPWQKETISLNDYIGKAVMVRFVFSQPVELNRNDANGWFIDDFSICYGPRPSGVSKVSIGNKLQAEGNSATTVLKFPVTIDPVNTAPITLAYETVGLDTVNAATPEVDYISTVAQKVIPAGTATTTLDVLVVGDDEPNEGLEPFQIKVTPVSSNVFLVNQAATGTIQDDDVPSTFTITVNGVSGNPPQIGETIGTAEVVVTIDQPRTVPITLNYQTFDDTAVSGAGLDFLAGTGSITFPPNTTEQTFPITILDDNVYEDPDTGTLAQENETFFVKLSTDSHYADPGVPQAMEIVDNDPDDPAISKLVIDPAVAAEGSCPDTSSEEICGSLTKAKFVVNLDHSNTNSISLTYTTVDGTAVDGQDYTAVSGTVTFNPGDTSKNIFVDILADRKVEAPEEFTLVLSDPSGPVNVVKNANKCIISDDDFNGLTFGMNGDRVFTRPVDGLDFTPYIDNATSGGPLDLTAAEFRGYDYSKLYGWVGTDLKEINLFSNSVISTPSSNVTVPLGYELSALAWDQTNGVAYAASTYGQLCTVDLDTAILTQVATLAAGTPIVALAVHPTTARIYAVVMDAGVPNLYTIIRGSWAFTLVGTLSDIAPGDPAQDGRWSADFDDATGDLYLNAYTTSGWVTKIVDLATAETRSIVQNPTVSSLAIASAPTPYSTQWSHDLYAADRQPSGVNFDGGTGLAGKDDGKVVASIGDVNGDTFDDYIITAAKADVTASSTIASAGLAFVLFGGPDGSASQWITSYLRKDVSFAQLLDGATGILVNGSTANQQLGVSAAGLGDVNGDKIADFAVGYVGANNAGGAYIIYGSRTLKANISASEIGTNTVAGVSLPGASADDHAGASISGAGDFNSDGHPDIIIGAPNALLTSVGARFGAAYVVFGTNAGIGTNGQLSLGALSSFYGLTLLGEAPGQGFGSSVSGAGDINGDGVDDIVVGAPNQGAGNGRAYVIYGHVDYNSSDPRLQKISMAGLNLATPPGQLAFTNIIPSKGTLAEFVVPSVANPNPIGLLPGLLINGQGGGFGTVAKGIGDFNGDGVGDLLISAPTFNGSALTPAHWGRIYLAFGQGSNPATTTAVNIGTTVAGALPGLILTGIDNNDLVGASAAGAGDVNGDGLMDVLIGAPGGESAGHDGEAYIVYGRKSFTGALSLRDLAGATSQEQKGTYLLNTHDGANFDFGRAVSGAGDFDDDGIADIVIGRDNGAFIFLGKSDLDQATYVNHARSGVNLLNGLPSTPPELGDLVSTRVGTLGDGTLSRPAARLAIDFKGGGTGSDLAFASTQTVTIFRKPSPDVIVGDNTPEDDARWVPGGVYWKVDTDRKSFSESTMTFYYRQAEIEGFDLDKVRVYYAKPGAEPNSHTTWSLLPVAYDPDRGAIIVHRNHQAASAESDFDGYYAIVRADFVVDMAQIIPAVGLTVDEVYAQGPKVTPNNLTYWHSGSKRLFAIGEGNVTVTWRNAIGTDVSTVNVITRWPDESTGRYQPYIANTTAVALDNTGSLPLQFHQLMSADTALTTSTLSGSATPANEVKLNKRFLAGLSSSSAGTFARALLMLATSPDSNQGDLYFQFLKVVNFNEPGYISAPFDFPIGTAVTVATDSVYAQYHDEATGSPLVLSSYGPNATSSTRYPGYYNPATRKGSIVWVNKSSTPAVLVYYQQGTRLIEGRTGDFLKQPGGVINAKSFAWPYYSGQYKPKWPAATDANTIVVSKQNGTQEIAPATYGTTIDVYVQNNAGLAGFNPNEEHALVEPYGSGQAVFALRNDLNSAATSDPWVLMTYNDPNDLDFDGNPRAKMKAWAVVQSTTQYPFSNWPNITGVNDPYEGEAGNLVLPPYPLSILRQSPSNTVDSGAFKDRNKSIWAIAAGSVTINVYYPLLPDFYLPAAYTAKYPGRDFSTQDVPWLDGGISGSGGGSGPVVYTTVWPDDAPVMKLGEVLIEARQGLPQIDGQCSVNVVYQQNSAGNGPGGNIVKLIDPVAGRSVDLDAVPLDVEQAVSGGDIVFPGLPPALNYRVKFNAQSKKLTFYGRVVDPVAGYDYPLLNVMTTADRDIMKGISSDAAWDTACDNLYNAAKNVITISESNVAAAEVLALSSGDAANVGYVSLVMQNDATCSPLPVSVEIIKVEADINAGSIAVVKPACVFEEKLTLFNINDFGGAPSNFTFEWKTRPDEDGTIPPLPDGSPTDKWVTPDLGVNNPNGGVGVKEITIKGPGILTLTDNWFTVRYKRTSGAAPWGTAYSDWTPPQLAPGWIKRVVGQINPFTQRAGGGGIAGAESQFAAFSANAPNAIASMISLAGPRYEGSVPLNCDNLDAFGLIPIYTTVLDRGATLSIDALSPINNPNVNNALILAASRINDLYMLLGNEAYADASDPTIAFGTDDGEYGAQATSIHAFMNQTSSLLEEELCLLRGRDMTYAPGVQTPPFYNKLVWNFTKDFTGGEVAYALNYNIADEVPGGDGVISEQDAKGSFPQGHGDAWGHYLTAINTYYHLLRHPYFAWTVRSEGYLVGGAPVTVDYLDERKFARNAAAKARAGSEIVNLEYRDGYVEDPDKMWQSMADDNTDRKWGFGEWAERAGQGSFIDWAVGNAILPAVDPNPAHSGITKIDRTTVADLNEVSAAYTQIQAQADTADLGMNPLGLGTNVIPFDISPSDIDDGLTHFEQIYSRALTAVNNAVTAFDNANNSTQLLRRQADTDLAFQRNVEDQEIDFNSRLIEIFGTPYSDDIGPGGAYPRNYNGPDLFHYMYTEDSPLLRDGQVKNVYFKASAGGNNQDDLPAYTTSVLANAPVVGDGEFQLQVNMKNYGLLDYTYTSSTSSSSAITLGTPVPTQSIPVKFNLALDTAGRLGLRKPSTWHGTREATGELQNAQVETVKALGELISALKEYENFNADLQSDIAVLQTKYNVKVAELGLKNTRFSDHKTLKNAIFAIQTTQIAVRTVVNVVEHLTSSLAKAIPTVTGIIIGFSNGIIIDGLAPARSAIETAGVVAAEILRAVADLAEIATLRIDLEDEFAQGKLELDLEGMDLNLDTYEALKELEKSLRGEMTLRLAIYDKYESVMQSVQNYSTVQHNADTLVKQLDIFRKRVSADVQVQRYKDMAFRIFRDDQLQKYRAQFDLAARYTYLSAKAYDYETTMLSTDPKAGQQFLTDIVKQRLIGTISDGDPQPGTGLANSLAIMGRNFSVLSGQLGFNNPQVETNRFSLRYELFRQLVGPAGDESWRDLLNQDYFTAGVGKVDNLWDVPEFVQNCVPPADFGSVEPGLIIPFSSTITEGKNFFGEDVGGFDNSYDSTQFATKIRSVGIWFSNYDFFNLSNTPRVYLIPAGTDVMRSPTGSVGTKRYFNVLDQILPVPYPIGVADLDSANWIPSVDGLDGQFTPVRRFGRLRAYHDSGEFSEDEVTSDSRLVGRSVWNTRWMLIIPGSTFANDSAEGLETFINGVDDGSGTRDGNGVKDIKVFFETYAYPRAKSAKAASSEKEAEATIIVPSEPGK